MELFEFSVKNVPVIAKVKVLVAGSGPAGISAAVASVRNGADTLLVEQNGCLGGALSSVNVQSYSFSINKNPEVLSGIPLEIDKRVRAYGAFMPDYRGSGIFVDSELYKCMLDEWMDECGVRVLLHTRIIGAYVVDGVLKGVYCHNKSGIGIILADCTVDATGDGDVAYLAGAEFDMRPKEKLQPVTVVFGISGVDTELFERHIKAHPDSDDASYGFRPVFKRAAEAGDWTYPKRGGEWKSLTHSGDIKSLNLTMMCRIDATDGFDVSKAEAEGRRQAKKIVEIFNKHGKDIGLGRCGIRSFAASLGVRETRRIRCDYTVTVNDILEKREFDDGIGRVICFIDSFGKIQKPQTGETFSLPYRALIPKGISGLLVAGRCISSDEEAYGAARLMVCCAITGEAAGTAAAICKDGDTHGPDVTVLREKLKNNGVVL